MKEFSKRLGLITQITLLFLLGMALTGVVSFMSQRNRSEASVRQMVEQSADQVSADVIYAIKEYPAYYWLLNYWYTNADILDIEYDVDYTDGTKTKEKTELFLEHNPGFNMKYATVEDISTLSDEDKKLYAEVTYSWLITRLNQIKRSYGPEFVFCVIANEEYDGQFFLLSAADEGAKRGNKYAEVYMLGNTVTVSESQQEAMIQASKYTKHLAPAGVYVDYYEFITKVAGLDLFVGLTYDLAEINETIAVQTRNGTIAAVIYLMLLFAILLLVVLFFVVRPLKVIQKNIGIYKSTKDSSTVEGGLESIRVHNEIGELSSDVLSLAREMDSYITNIKDMTAESERINAELSLATRIQADMLPSIYPAYPDRHEFEIYGSMDPAKEVGGDFYNFFLIDDDHLCLTIADVSGKGVPAALFMMVTEIVIAENAQGGKTPAQILMDTNNAICEYNREEMFVTVWVGILEISTGKIIAANAGHEYPIITDENGDFQIFKDKHGFVIGGMSGIKYTNYEMQLKPGSKLFLYTDGVPESTNKKDEQFDLERALAVLNSNKDCTPEELTRAVRAAVEKFADGAEQFDDITMLCLEYNGGSDMGIKTEANESNLDKILDYVSAKFEEAGASPKVITELAIAVEEIYINVAHYAYKPDTGPATVKVDIDKENRVGTVTISDNGKPYNPLEREDPDITASAEDRPIGGLGILMTKKLVDEAEYEYKDNQNVMKLKKAF